MYASSRPEDPYRRKPTAGRTRASSHGTRARRRGPVALPGRSTSTAGSSTTVFIAAAGQSGAKLLPQHELLDLAARCARELLDVADVLGPLLLRQAHRSEEVAYLCEGRRRRAGLHPEECAADLAEAVVGRRNHRDFRDSGYPNQQLFH